ncbi:MAG: MarR family transcriptional regulator [Oleiphilaceae bacterium]|nr:MarR family transcriptional regulator [Oleiphilaceae bacterium]
MVSPEIAAAHKLSTELRIKIFKLNGLLLREIDLQKFQGQISRAGSLLLAIVARHGQPLTASRLAEEMGQSRQGVGRMVNKLAEQGFLELSDNPYHKGSRLISLTEKGQAQHQGAVALHNQLTREWPLPVGEEELEVTVNCLEKIIDHLSSSTAVY